MFNEDLLAKRITRRQFLVYLLVGFVVLVGLGKYITPPTSSGFGRSTYGS